MDPTPKEVVTRWFVALWRERDPSVIGTTRDASSKSRGLSQRDIEGIDAFRAFYDRLSAVVTDTDVRFNQILEQDDWVGAHVTITGNVRDKPVEIHASVFGRVVDGVLVQGNNLVDVAGLMKQVGHDVPATISEAIAIIEEMRS